MRETQLVCINVSSILPSILAPKPIATTHEEINKLYPSFVHQAALFSHCFSFQVTTRCVARNRRLVRCGDDTAAAFGPGAVRLELQASSWKCLRGFITTLSAFRGWRNLLPQGPNTAGAGDSAVMREQHIHEVRPTWCCNLRRWQRTSGDRDNTEMQLIGAT